MESEFQLSEAKSSLPVLSFSNGIRLEIQFFAVWYWFSGILNAKWYAPSKSDFDGAYHFAFNIPENQYHTAKNWISSRIPLLKDKTGKEDFASESWNSDSIYFLDASGNILEFIARHNLQNATDGSFDSSQILNVSEIGLPSENVIELASRLCTEIGLSVFKQELNATFTPVG